jgi:integrase
MSVELAALHPAIAPKLPRVSGHVFRKPSARAGDPDRWYLKWRDHDGQHQIRLGLHWGGRGAPPAGHLRRLDAEALLADFLVERRREAQAIYEGRLALSRSGATLTEVATAWLTRAGGERPWKPATRRNYEKQLFGRRTYLLPALGHRSIRVLSRAELRAWWATLRDPRRPGGPLSIRNANAQLALFRNIIRWADSTDEYGPVGDPSRGIRKWAEDPLGDKTDFFEPEEVMALCRAAERLHREMRLDPDRLERAHASRHDAAIILVAAFTGMRRGEVISLRWREVDFGASSIHIRESVSAGEDSTPKGRRARTVTMASQVAQVLAPLAPDDARHSTELVFPGTRPGNKLDPDALSKRFTLAREAAGLRKLSFHDLRHTFASLLARAGEPVTVIQAEAGHADLRTTERYMHHRPRRQDAERFGQAFAVDAVDQLEVAAAA